MNALRYTRSFPELKVVGLRTCELRLSQVVRDKALLHDLQQQLQAMEVFANTTQIIRLGNPQLLRSCVANPHFMRVSIVGDLCCPGSQLKFGNW